MVAWRSKAGWDTVGFLGIRRQLSRSFGQYPDPFQGYRRTGSAGPPVSPPRGGWRSDTKCAKPGGGPDPWRNPYNPSMALPPEVCIRGAGIVGRTLALLLARERVRVALVVPP